jgi:hypothetical protein
LLDLPRTINDSTDTADWFCENCSSDNAAQIRENERQLYGGQFVVMNEYSVPIAELHLSKIA